MSKAAEKRFDFIVSVVFTALIIALFYVALKFVFPLLLPFAVAFLIAALLNRPIKKLSSRFPRLPERLIAALVIFIFLATAGTAIVLLAGALINETLDFIADIPRFISDFAESLGSEDAAVSGFLGSLPPWLGKYARELYRRFAEDAPSFLLNAADSLSAPLLSSFGAIGSFAMKLPSAVLVLLITVIMTFFIGTDYGGIKKLIDSLTPRSIKARFNHIRSCSADTVVCLLKTYAFLMLLTFTELAVGFALINLLGGGIAHAVPLALLTALVDILPVLGVGTVLIPWAAYDMLAGSMSRGIMLLVLYAVIVVIRNFLEPKLVGERFGLHPALTLLAIYIGGKLFGFIGVFALPLTVIIAKRLSDAGAFGVGRNSFSAMDNSSGT